MAKDKTPIPNAEIKQLITAAEEGFMKMVKATGNTIVFQQEALFAMKAMLENDYLAQTAKRNPTSLKMALVQIASSGLTLNPAMSLAYLVPRDGKVIADISYRGLIKIATDSRAVNLVVAEAVYSNDAFRYRGSSVEPIHDFDPFLPTSARGEFRGVYIKAHLAIGCLLVTCLSAEEVYAARDLSSAWKNGSVGKKGPWETHFKAMALKTAIKAARKFWPMTSPILDQVISYLNEDAGEGIAPSAVTLGVAAAEMGADPMVGALQIGHEPTIPMPVMDVMPRAQTPEPVMASVAPLASVQAAPEQTASVAAPAQSSIASNGGPSEVEIDPKVLKRIENVLQRSIRTNSWEAAYDWANGYLEGADLDYALTEFSKAQALKKAS